MTPEQIAEAREIISAATPGPWDAENNGREIWDVSVKGSFPIVADDCCGNDAKFIAAARTGWPEALSSLEAAYKRIAELEAIK
jgi:hypothetical protein